MNRLRPRARQTFVSSRPHRLIAALGAIALVLGTVLLGAVPASASSTFTVTGTVPTGSGGSVEVVDLVWDASASAFVPGSVAVLADTTTGAFSFMLPAGTPRYTVGFIPDHLPYLPTILGGLTEPPTSDALSASVFAGAAGSTKAFGAVSLLPAGVIQGTVTSSADGTPIVGGDVEAFDADGDVFDATTGADGSYYLAVSDSPEDYEISLDADGFIESFYPGVEDENHDTTVDLDAGNSFTATGIDFTADPEEASILGDFGTGEAEVYLYSMSGGAVTSSIPVQSDDSAENSLEFDNVAPGDYGIALRDSATGKWIPWDSYTGSAGVPAATGGPTSCIIDVTITGTTSVDLGSVKLGGASTSTCSAPWGSASSYSGQVTNMAAGASVSAWLYYVQGDGTLDAVNRSEVAADGTYSIDGVSAPGQYIVYFEIDTPTEPFLDTWSDGLDADDSDTLATVIADTPAITTTNQDSPGHDVVLFGASFLSGTVESNGLPLAGADVEAANSSESIVQDVTTGSDGSYLLRVAPGTDYLVAVYDNGFTTQYWDDVTDPQDATLVLGKTAGQTTSGIDFSMQGIGTAIDGFVIRVDSGSEQLQPDFARLTAYLYKHEDGYWKKVSSESATDFEGEFNLFEFPSGATALAPGSYRLRFESPAGWVAFSEYAESTSLDSGADPMDVVGPTCYVSVSDLVANEQRGVVAAVDIDDTTTKCHGEPGPTAASIRQPTTASWVTAASASVPTATPTPTPTPTPTSSSAPVSTPSPSPTPRAAPGADLAWVFWLVGGLIAAGIVVLLAIILFRRRP